MASFNMIEHATSGTRRVIVHVTVRIGKHNFSVAVAESTAVAKKLASFVLISSKAIWLPMLKHYSK